MKLRPTFSIRDLFWLALVAALVVVAWIDRTDRQRLAKENDKLQKKIKADQLEFEIKLLSAKRTRRGGATILIDPDAEFGGGFPGGKSFGGFGSKTYTRIPNEDEEQTKPAASVPIDLPKK